MFSLYKCFFDRKFLVPLSVQISKDGFYFKQYFPISVLKCLFFLFLFFIISVQNGGVEIKDFVCVGKLLVSRKKIRSQ